MIDKGWCRLYYKTEEYATIYINMYASGKIMTHWYQRNKEVMSKCRKRQYIKFQKIMLNLKINGCAVCGYNKCSEALDFHHANPQEKIFVINMSAAHYDNTRITKELNKCILLCANCHREIHNKERCK